VCSRTVRILHIVHLLSPFDLVTKRHTAAPCLSSCQHRLGPHSFYFIPARHSLLFRTPDLHHINSIIAQAKDAYGAQEVMLVCAQLGPDHDMKTSCPMVHPPLLLDIEPTSCVVKDSLHYLLAVCCYQSFISCALLLHLRALLLLLFPIYRGNSLISMMS
jgi:hypothetical protein